MIKEENLKTAMSSRIITAVISIILIGFGISIFTGIADIHVLVEAWGNSTLSVFTVWWPYVGVGVLLLIAACVPSAYQSARLYNDRLELVKKETNMISFARVFDVTAKNRVVKITFKDGTPQVNFTCHKNSSFPQEVSQAFAKWSTDNVH